MTELNKSRLYSFLDDRDNYVVTFLEGQKVILDLALSHGYHGHDLAFFRDAVLSTVHIIQFFKNNESLGFYVDSEKPSFHFKLETNSNGYVRALKIPEGDAPVPTELNGVVRLVKMTPHQREPYQSIIRVQKASVEAMVNQILEQSYQIHAQVVLSDETDQSVMVSRLPAREADETLITPREFLLKHRKDFVEIFKRQLNDDASLTAAFEERGFRYLAATDITLHCPCSKENVIVSLGTLLSNELGDMRARGEEALEVKCQYCRKAYKITAADLESVSIN